MKRAYATWVKLDLDGRVLQSFFRPRAEGSPGPGWEELVDEADWPKVRGARALQYLVRAGRAEPKPTIRIAPDQPAARHRSGTIVRFHGVPADHGPLHLIVGGIPVVVPAGQTLDLSWDNPARIRIRLDEPLLQGEPAEVEFTR